MIKLSLEKPHLRVVPDLMRPFVRAGKVDRIFRPRIFANGVFATATGYGVSFSLGGIDSEGLDRLTLNHVSKQIAIANRMVPEECIVYEYLITAKNDELPDRSIQNEAVCQQAQERTEFLRANAKFKSVGLIVTLYLPGKVAEEAEEFAIPARMPCSWVARLAPSSTRSCSRRMTPNWISCPRYDAARCRSCGGITPKSFVWSWTSKTSGCIPPIRRVSGVVLRRSGNTIARRLLRRQPARATFNIRRQKPREQAAEKPRPVEQVRRREQGGEICELEKFEAESSEHELEDWIGWRNQ